MAVETLVNGIPVEELEATINTIRETPDLAWSHFRAHGRWIDGGHNRTEIQDFYSCGEEQTGRAEPFVLDADEPPLLLGHDNGPNPVEYALKALAACVTTTFVYYAAAQGVHIEELRTELEGDIDLRGFLGISGKVRSGYQNIRVRFHVKSDAPREKLEGLCKLAERRSPVSDTIRNPVDVSVGLAE